MKLRRILFGVLLTALSLNLSATKVGNPNYCPPDVDAGALVCRSGCSGVTTCRYSTDRPVASYCWVAYGVGGTRPMACHNGDYDPCCDPNYQW